MATLSHSQVVEYAAELRGLLVSYEKANRQISTLGIYTFLILLNNTFIHHINIISEWLKFYFVNNICAFCLQISRDSQ